MKETVYRIPLELKESFNGQSISGGLIERVLNLITTRASISALNFERSRGLGDSNLLPHKNRPQVLITGV